MAEYGDMLAPLKLYQALVQSTGRDGLTASDVAQLQGLVASVTDSIGPVLQRIPLTFRQYTEHDFRHCRNLIEHMGDFIPPQTLGKLNALEISLLLLGALLHDIGMVVTDTEKRTTLDSPAFRSFLDHVRFDFADEIEEARHRGDEALGRLIEDAVLAEYFRRIHPGRVAAYLQANFAERLMFRDLDLSVHVAQLCESHSWGVEDANDPLNPEKVVRNLDDNVRLYRFRVNLQYLACCLRLADILDFDRSRTPLAVFRQIEFTASKSWEEWNKHLQVQGLEISPTRIGFDIPCTHPVFYVAVHQFLDAIDQELRQCRYLVDNKPRETAGRYQLRLPQAVDRHKVRMKDPSYMAGAFRFQLEFNEIVSLLMDRSLYPSNSLFLRELIQNALDACRRKEAETRSFPEEDIHYYGRIDVHYQDSEGHVVVEVRDNGVGMSLRIVEQFFMRVGRSYYRSPEFDQERARLLASGIELDACSQFGIGILSCFLVADRFEVETFQQDNEPLHITIEGPAKYFVIKRLPKPATRRSGATGTKISVFLRRVLDVDLFDVLNKLAVNVDFEIVFNGEQRISAKRWEKEIIVPRVEDRHPGRTREETRLIDLSDILTPYRIPFEKWDFSRHIHGRAWLWLLKSKNGDSTPSDGFLRISRRIRVTGAAEFIMRLGRAFEAVSSSTSRVEMLIRRIRQGIGGNAAIRSAFEAVLEKDATSWFRSQRLEMWEMEGLFGDFDDFWNSIDSMDDQWTTLPLQDQAQVVDVLEDRYSQIPESQERPWEIWRQRQWTAIDGIFGDLLGGSLGWVKSLSFAELPSGEIFCNLPDNIQEVGLFGIRVPEGVVKWQSGSVQSSRVDLFPFPGGCQVDFRGVKAPRPAAHRLFIPFDGAQEAYLSVARATLHCCADLVAREAGNFLWREWFAEIWRDAYPTDIMIQLRALDRPYIEIKCGLAAAVSGQISIWSRKELVAQFGPTIPVLGRRIKGGNGNGLLSDDGINIFCFGDALSEGEVYIG